MNFFGHAAVASSYGTAPGYVLGAMLPDFCTMARVRLVEAGHDAVAAGVRMHHRTDAIFHDAPTFLSLCSLAVRELTERGVGRGGARAVAHIGTELLLDGVIVERGGPRDAYLEALDAARDDRLGGHLTFRDAEEQGRFRHLRERLVQWGVPDGYGDPGFVADRLVGLLSRRPRLALDDAEASRVRAWLLGARDRVASHADALLDEVHDGLVGR